MMGMEKMLGSMIGKTPDELKQTVAEFETMIKSASEALIHIAKTQTEILAKLEAIQNGPGN